MSTPTEREQLQEAIREAHGMLKDLSRVVKRAEKVRDDLKDLVKTESRKQVDEHVHQHVVRAAEEVQSEMQGAVDRGVAQVNKIFKEMSNTLMFGNKKGRGESLLDLADRLREDRQ